VAAAALSLSTREKCAQRIHPSVSLLLSRHRIGEQRQDERIDRSHNAIGGPRRHTAVGPHRPSSWLIGLDGSEALVSLPFFGIAACYAVHQSHQGRLVAAHSRFFIPRCYYRGGEEDYPSCTSKIVLPLQEIEGWVGRRRSGPTCPLGTASNGALHPYLTQSSGSSREQLVSISTLRMSWPVPGAQRFRTISAIIACGFSGRRRTYVLHRYGSAFFLLSSDPI